MRSIGSSGVRWRRTVRDRPSSHYHCGIDKNRNREIDVFKILIDKSKLNIRDITIRSNLKLESLKKCAIIFELYLLF